MRAISSFAREQPLERGGLLEDLGAEERAGGRGPQPATRVSPADEHALDLEVVVEHHHVGPPADPEPAEIAEPEDAGGNERRGLGGPLERDAELDEVPHRLDHRQRAARENPVVAAGDAAVDGQVDAAERIVAVAEAGGRDRVGDEREPARRDAPEQAHDVTVEVDAVDDRLHARRRAARAPRRRCQDRGASAGASR